MTPLSPEGESGLEKKAGPVSGSDGPHGVPLRASRARGLPGGRPHGVLFCVIVLFAHFLCKKKEGNTIEHASLT